MHINLIVIFFIWMNEQMLSSYSQSHIVLLGQRFRTVARCELSAIALGMLRNNLKFGKKYCEEIHLLLKLTSNRFELTTKIILDLSCPENPRWFDTDALQLCSWCNNGWNCPLWCIGNPENQVNPCFRMKNRIEDSIVWEARTIFICNVMLLNIFLLKNESIFSSVLLVLLEIRLK